MNTDIMLQSFKIIPLYLIKETNTRLIHFCVDKSDNFFICFSQKTFFEEEFCMDLKSDYNLYKCHFKQKEDTDNLISIVNSSLNFDHKLNLDSNFFKYLNLLCELLYKCEQKKLNNFYNILIFIFNCSSEVQKIFIIVKIFLIIVKNNVNFPLTYKTSSLETEILEKSYEQVKDKITIELLKNIVKSYNLVLEQYGLELYYLKKI